MKRVFASVLILALAAEFTDVSASHTFHDAIAACSASGIVGGYSDGTFRPGNTVTKSNPAQTADPEPAQEPDPASAQPPPPGR